MTSKERAKQIADKFMADLHDCGLTADDLAEDIAAAIHAAVREEREACAKVAEAIPTAYLPSGNWANPETVRANIAHAIQERQDA